VRLRTIAPGDIVLVNKRGRLFHALVKGTATGGELTIEPLDKRVSYRHATPREVADHWQHRERREPGQPADGQLALLDAEPPPARPGGRFGRAR
jgi:hypothetical protein